MLQIAEEVILLGQTRLTAPYGETRDRVRCLANGDGDPQKNARDLLVDLKDEWIDRWTWCPGNHTKYELIYGCRQVETVYPTRAGMSRSPEGKERLSEFVVGYIQPGRMMIFSEPTHLHHSYIEEKLDVNTADAVGILLFLDQMGHSVGYPDSVIMTRLATTYPGIIKTMGSISSARR